MAGKRADFLGNPDLPHSYSYVPDIAAGLATLGTDERAVGQVWHLPGPETVTTRTLLDIVAHEVNHPVAIRSVPKIALHALGPVHPRMRSLAEMAYMFEPPFPLDTPTYQPPFTAPPPPPPPPPPHPPPSRAPPRSPRHPRRPGDTRRPAGRRPCRSR